MAEQIATSLFQRRGLFVPEIYDVFLGGGRAGGKSSAEALFGLRHAEQHRERGRILYIRRSHQGCADFEGICLTLFGSMRRCATTRSRARSDFPMARCSRSISSRALPTTPNFRATSPRPVFRVFFWKLWST